MCGRMFSRCSPSYRLAYPRIATLINAFLKSSNPREFTPSPISSYSFYVIVDVLSLTRALKIRTRSSEVTIFGTILF